MHNIILAHRILVSLFLLQYLVKLILLLAGKKEELAHYSKATRIPEMLVSIGFLVTGVWMMLQLPAISSFMIVKIICVFAAIPMAVVGFKKGNKAVALLSVVLILASYGLAEVNKGKLGAGKIDTSAVKDPLEVGKIVYQKKGCMDCHGFDGKLATAGAKDLSVTKLTIDEQKDLIKNGKSPMPAYKDLTLDQLNDVIEYVGTFKK